MSDLTPIQSGTGLTDLLGTPMQTDDSNGADMGKQEFLELLIAQLRYQDPLEPLSNQEYSAQLAQFSQLEQLQNMNTALGESLEINLLLTQSINNTLSSTIIGKDVKAIGNALSITEENPEADINFKLGDYSKNLTITISDEDGNVIRTEELYGYQAGEHTFTWDGMDEDGNPVETGNYSYSISATSEDNTDVRVIEYIYGSVDSVRYENGSAIFQVNGEDVPFSQVLEIGANGNG